MESFELTYTELSQKTRFQSVPIAVLCLYNIECENLVFKNSPCISGASQICCPEAKCELNKIFNFTIQ